MLFLVFMLTEFLIYSTSEHWNQISKQNKQVDLLRNSNLVSSTELLTIIRTKISMEWSLFPLSHSLPLPLHPNVILHQIWLSLASTYRQDMTFNQQLAWSLLHTITLPNKTTFELVILLLYFHWKSVECF